MVRFLCKFFAVCVALFLPIGNAPVWGETNSASQKSPQAWQIAGIRAGFADSSIQVRAQALIISSDNLWGSFLDPQQVVPLLGNADAKVRVAAASALGQMGKVGSPFATQIAPLLIDPENSVKVAAANAIGQMGKQSVAFVKEIVPHLSDPDVDVQNAVVNTLSQIGKENSEVATQLVPLLKSSDPKIRRLSVEALGLMGASNAAMTEQIYPLVIDVDPDVRRSTATALAQICNQDGTIAPHFVPLLKDIEPKVRVAAIDGVKQMGKEGATLVDSIIALLRDPNIDVRRSVVDALGVIATQDDTVAAKVAPFLSDGEISMRVASVSAIGRMRKQGVVLAPKIFELLNDPESVVRRAAVEALDQLKLINEKGQNATVRLLEALKDPDGFVRGSAAAALARIEQGKHPVGEKILPLLNDDIVFARTSSITALRELSEEGNSFAAQIAPLLQDTDNGVRNTAAESLGKMGREGAIFAAQLIPLLEDANDSSVRRVAVEALGRMGMEGAAFANNVFPLLRDSDLDVRGSAVDTLLQMRNAGAVIHDQLLSLLRDTAGNARESASMALDRMGNQSPNKINQYNWLISALDALQSEAASEHPALRAHLRLWCGGHDELQLSLNWLGDPNPEPMPEKDLPTSQIANILTLFSEFWDQAEKFPAEQRELAIRIAQITTAVPPLPNSECEKTLKTLQIKLKNRPETSEAIDRALDRIKTGKWLKRAAILVLIHLCCWTVLLVAYPRWVWVQTFCFWNPWFRKFLGFPYVSLALRYIPFVRRQLFAPFADVLVADARLEQLAHEEWFPNLTVRDLNIEPNKRRSLALGDAVHELRGQVVLIGESGLGKTMLLRHLIQNAVANGRIVAFLLAEDCHDGILEALEKRLEGPAKDHEFLRELVFAGAIDLGIDGLNQVPPDTRAKVSEFMTTFVRGTIMVTTQPMAWRTPPLARRYRLEPLATDKILAFLRSREPLLPRDAQLLGDRFRLACADYLSGLISIDPVDGAREKSARDVLSNPLDATVAAELLATGLNPDLLDLPKQQYEAMAVIYYDETRVTFPLMALAEETYEMRVAGVEIFPAEKFPRELEYLSYHRLLTRRQSLVAGDGSQQEWWVFRHEKFWEFFVVHAFLGDEGLRRDEHLGDPPFRGVYLRLAQILPLEEADELCEKFVYYAAETGDHSTSDEYVRTLKHRKELEMVRDLQQRDSKLRGDVATAIQRVPLEPLEALSVLDECWSETGLLEEKIWCFLRLVGDPASIHAQGSRECLRTIRFPILAAKAEALTLLGRCVESISTIALARLYLSDEKDSLILDQTETKNKRQQFN